MLTPDSLINSRLKLSYRERDELIQSLSEKEKEIATYTWELWGRQNQLEPTREEWLAKDTTSKLIRQWMSDPMNQNQEFKDSWRTWLYLAGRGNGKTRSGAEWVRQRIETGGVSRMALVAPTAADARDTMVEGESGIMNHCPPWNMPTYISSKRRVEWPNGAIATMYSAEEANRLRGPQHEAAWCDELTSWGDIETWDMLLFGLRIGTCPQVLVTTTSKIGHKLLKTIIKDPYTITTHGHTFENASNLHPQFIEHIRKKYEGTRLGRQELEGKYIDEGVGVLWSEDVFQYVDHAPLLDKVIVSVDPAITSTAEGAETGIVVVGKDSQDNGYLLADHSGHYSPQGWAQKAIDLYNFYKANYIVAEINNGGDMVLSTIKNIDPGVKTKKVVATRGKRTRAEPVSMLYEQGRVWHIGKFSKLEEQMIDFNPEEGDSPDRVDAAVWGFTELIINPNEIKIRYL